MGPRTAAAGTRLWRGGPQGWGPGQASDTKFRRQALAGEVGGSVQFLGWLHIGGPAQPSGRWPEEPGQAGPGGQWSRWGPLWLAWSSLCPLLCPAGLAVLCSAKSERGDRLLPTSASFP